MSSLDHILIFSLMYIVFFASLKHKQDYIHTNYWRVLFWPIVVYSLAFGLRYGWGVDYIRYATSFETKTVSMEYDIGFAFISNLFHAIGMNKFWMELILFSALFIVSFALCVRHIDFNKYILLLFVPATAGLSSTAIRQSLAISFTLIGLYFFLTDKNHKYYHKYGLSTLFIFVGYTVHGGSLAFSIPIVLVYLLGILKVDKPIPGKIAVCIYIASIIWADLVIVQTTNFMDTYGALFIATEHLQGYVDSYDVIFANEQVDMFAHSGIFMYVEYAGRLCFILLSSKALVIRPSKIVALFFNVFLVGMCLQQVFFTSEIFHRLVDPFYMLYFIPLGYAFGVLSDNISTRRNPHVITLSHVSLFYIIYPVLKFILFFDNSSFVWNH